MPNRPRKKSTSQRFFAGAIYTLFLLLMLLVGTAVGWMRSSEFLWKGVTNYFVTPQEMFHTDALTVLVLGCDEDRAPGGRVITKEGVRSDMMLLVRLDFANKRVTGLSIPRDTLATVDGKTHKVNAFHAIGGNDMARRAVEELLDGIHVDRVVELDFDAFEKLVNTVGGVPIVIDKNLRYTDHAGHLNINLKKGYQTLDGEHAMEFVRFRHSDSDFARQDRQHQFILALKGAIEKRPQVLPRVADLSVQVLGNAFNPGEAQKLATFTRSVKEANIRLGAVPVLEKKGTTALTLDDEKLDEVLREYNFKSPASQPTASAQ